MLSSGVSATLFYLKAERSSSPRELKTNVDEAQRLFACQVKKHWPPCSGTCPRCRCFDHSSSSSWSPCPGAGTVTCHCHHGWVYPKVAELHISDKSRVGLVIQLSQRGLLVTILFTLPQSGVSAATELVPIWDIKTSHGQLCRLQWPADLDSCVQMALAVVVLSLLVTIRWYHRNRIMINIRWWPTTASSGLSGNMSLPWYRDNHL